MHTDRTQSRNARSALLIALVTLLFLTLLAARPAAAQPPGACILPAAEHRGQVGCYLSASDTLGALPNRPLYWHLYDYPTVTAARTARGPHGTVVRSFGHNWLFTIADSAWHPSSGHRVAVIGPLPLEKHGSYTARYLETVTKHGLYSMVHRHSGPEAWYLLNGTQCVETPLGKGVVSAGHTAIVPEGPPMLLGTSGMETRRAVVLVLHDTTKPWVTKATDWKPKGLCG